MGSGTLGAVFALLGISTIQQVGWTVVHAFLPLMPLFTDEVLTMTRRIAEGQPLYPVAIEWDVFNRAFSEADMGRALGLSFVVSRRSARVGSRRRNSRK